MSAALAHAAYDEYVDFCEGVRRLSGIDLLQYKRGQMERRLRTLAERRGFAAAGGLPRVARAATPTSSTASSTA